MREKGAQALAARGEADVTEGSILSDFDTWQTDCLWPGISEAYSTSSATVNTGDVFDFARFTADNAKARTNILEAKILEVRALTTAEDRPKWHMEVEIPDEAHYNVGDYIEVYPENSSVDRDMLMDVLRARGFDLKDPMITTMCEFLDLGHQASSKVCYHFLQYDAPIPIFSCTDSAHSNWSFCSAIVDSQMSETLSK